MLTPIFLMVGFIEIISITFRPVSLSFRLYGNVFGGENLLTSMTGMANLHCTDPFLSLRGAGRRRTGYYLYAPSGDLHRPNDQPRRRSRTLINDFHSAGLCRKPCCR